MPSWLRAFVPVRHALEHLHQVVGLRRIQFLHPGGAALARLGHQRIERIFHLLAQLVDQVGHALAAELPLGVILPAPVILRLVLLAKTSLLEEGHELLQRLIGQVLAGFDAGDVAQDQTVFLVVQLELRLGDVDVGDLAWIHKFNHRDAEAQRRGEFLFGSLVIRHSLGIGPWSLVICPLSVARICDDRPPFAGRAADR